MAGNDTDYFTFHFVGKPVKVLIRTVNETDKDYIAVAGGLVYADEKNLYLGESPDNPTMRIAQKDVIFIEIMEEEDIIEAILEHEDDDDDDGMVH